MKKSLYLIFIFLILINCSSKIKEVTETKHVFYLHGRIIEEQGKEAYSAQFGKYELDSIVAVFKNPNTKVYDNMRTTNVDVKVYAKQISKQIDSLILLKVKPKNITVIGASKGAVIAQNISDMNTNAINYVFLAGNNNQLESQNNWKFHGQVLCIYDLSDAIAGKNYNHWQNNPNFTKTFKQIELKTKLGHGFIYKPLKEWVTPVQKWIENQEL